MSVGGGSGHSAGYGGEGNSDGYHAPIMVPEVLNFIRPERGGIFVDGTLGGGGHAKALLDAMPQSGRLIGIDRDADAIAAAGGRLVSYGERFTAIHGNFFDMTALLAAHHIFGVDGILLDLGVSSHQLDTPERGFSYHEDAPLDMRMDAAAPLTAGVVVNTYPFEELARILREYGEERYAGRIASAVVRERQKAPIESTAALAQIIKGATPAGKRWGGQHPARRSFQAIRIEVNGELGGLGQALQAARDILRAQGRLAVITFHSLEDRIAKQLFREWENPCTCPPKAPQCVCGKTPSARLLSRKPLIAAEAEIERNPRARSAKLRGIEKL
ncbi:MAG: 16S rRNA (cytosine(1402)-N(4))-methyltransferase RsmH [Clostridiales bacterium]|jgi:16S rRNA (cytosine1402-N4)-methyltransferase|nr:16S rRNA (cytosine(1402)-N(4))-methyltransferase RsmH [Clostridiales bacterium]